MPYRWSPERGDEQLPSTALCEGAVDCDELSLLWTSQVTSATPYKSCPRGLSPSWSLSSRHTLVVWCPSYAKVPKTAHSTRGGASAVQCRVGQSPVLTGWRCCAWCTPGRGWPFGPPGHTVDSYSTCHQPNPPDLFLGGRSPASCASVCM